MMEFFGEQSINKNSDSSDEISMLFDKISEDAELPNSIHLSIHKDSDRELEERVKRLEAAVEELRGFCNATIKETSNLSKSKVGPPRFELGSPAPKAGRITRLPYGPFVASLFLSAPSLAIQLSLKKLILLSTFARKF